MSVVGIIQARMGSARLPGKTMKLINGQPLLELLINRVKRAGSLDLVVVATTQKPEDDPIADLAKKCGVDCFRGSDNDVLDRFLRAARKFGAKTVVRICADNPLTSAEEIDRIVAHHLASEADYSFNHVPRLENGYPDGLGAEVLDLQVLEKVGEKAKEKRHREHVTLYIWDNNRDFRIETIKALPEIRGEEIKLDIDSAADFTRVSRLIQRAHEGGRDYVPAVEIVRLARKP